ncbi:SRPBCC domain-containing protein [Streptomyces diacarni]|uniref:SRPBCC family protein n=1 Tax=Streptomyces diacarni TaxID=2800381 RepID=UPI0033CE5596
MPEDTLQPRGFTVHRTYPATTQEVFDAFLAVYGPQPEEWVLESQLDLRPGGRWWLRFAPPGVEPFTEDRRLTVVDPPGLLRYTARIDAPGNPAYETDVTLELTATPDGQTRLALTQTGFPDSELARIFEENWPGVLELAAQRLA